MMYSLQHINKYIMCKRNAFKFVFIFIYIIPTIVYVWFNIRVI